MATIITKNSFQGGMDKDTDPKQVEQIRFVDGYNVSLSQDGNYKQLSTFDGTATVQTILEYTNYDAADEIHIMGMYYAEYLIDGVAEDCILTFVYNNKAGSEMFYIYAVDVINGIVYKQYSESIVLTEKNRFVDCVVYKEGGVSYAYFTDGETPMKKLPCVISIGGLGDGSLASSLDRDYTFTVIGIQTATTFRPTFLQSGAGTDFEVGESYYFAFSPENDTYTNGKYTVLSLVDADVVEFSKTNPNTTSTGGSVSEGREYSRDAILLTRTGFRGTITDQQVVRGTGGDLANGSYQFAWRLLNNTTNKYTKWSLIQQPAMVGMGWNKDIQLKYRRSFGGVGYVSDAEIQLSLKLEENYEDGTYYGDGLGLYTHYQLAVIENINGFQDKILSFKILQPELISDFNYSAVPDTATTTYKYSTNKIAHQIESIDELTIDDAAILAVRALAIKNNRLIVGGLTYHDLDYDNGTPIMNSTSGAITHEIQSSLNEDGSTGGAAIGSKAVGYRDPDNATNYVGYFRDEVYRFAITYYDEFGNYSRPVILDLSGATGITNTTAANRVSEGKDFRFPPRTSARFGTPLNSFGHIQALGLRLIGLKNHPKWAKGFAILRAPRKKKILFQTPVVPSILVMPATALGEYPSQRRNAQGKELPLLNVEASNPDGSFFPKNFFHILTKSMLRFSDFYGLDGSGGGKVFGSNSYNGKKMIFNSSIAGTTPLAKTASPSETFMYDGNSPNSTLTISYGDTLEEALEWNGGQSPALLVTLYRRDIGTAGLWGSVSEHSDYRTSVTTLALDLTQYDYFVTCVEDAATAPTAPTNVSAYDTRASQVDTNWTNTASTATGYKIYRHENAQPSQPLSYSLIDTISSPTLNFYQDDTVQDQYYYVYKIAAYNSAGESNSVPSNEVQATDTI